VTTIGQAEMNMVGTSFAAPQVASMGVYAMEQYRCKNGEDHQKALQETRAALMASAIRPITVAPEPGELCGGQQCQTGVYRLITGSSSNAWEQRRWAAGAGGVDAGTLQRVIGNDCATHGPENMGGSSGTLDILFPEDAPPPDPTRKRVFFPEQEGDELRCRVAIAWQPLPSCNGTSCSESKGFDIDMCLYTPDEQLLGCAASWDNNYEFMDVDCPREEHYLLEIIPYAGMPGAEATVGYAGALAWPV
jgi:hypothetical protein